MSRDWRTTFSRSVHFQRRQRGRFTQLIFLRSKRFHIATFGNFYLHLTVIIASIKGNKYSKPKCNHLKPPLRRKTCGCYFRTAPFPDIARSLKLSHAAVSKALQKARPAHPAVAEAIRLIKEAGSQAVLHDLNLLNQ